MQKMLIATFTGGGGGGRYNSRVRCPYIILYTWGTWTVLVVPTIRHIENNADNTFKVSPIVQRLNSV